MIQTTRARVSRHANHGDVVEYLLGLGAYAYLGPYRYTEEYHRLHRLIRAMAHAPTGDREIAILGYGAQLGQIDRVLAALFVAGCMERLAASTGQWSHISEETYFAVAAERGALIDYASFANHFCVPPTSDHYDQLARYRRFAHHFLGLAEGHGRQGLRLGVLSLFERGTDDVAVGLALCEQLRGRDPLLAAMAAERVLLALERAEVAGHDPAYRDLGVRMVAAAGRWSILPALPHLRRLLDGTPPRDRRTRVLRANIQQAIEQLTAGRR